MRVNGLGLGDVQESVVRVFGKPVKVAHREAEPCVGGMERTLHYSGLWIGMHDDPSNPKRFTVSQFVVTSPKWDVSGVRVGSTQAAVRTRFGSNYEQERQRGAVVWSYPISDEHGGGSSNFYFVNGRVTKIESIYMLC